MITPGLSRSNRVACAKPGITPGELTPHVVNPTLATTSVVANLPFVLTVQVEHYYSINPTTVL
jgi:hypothetical protein